ncbi:PREDICTED: serine/threonine-protein kinase 19 isoform X2 [Populus euphratica]|uniref:Serine/threonine-protein kinase 19 isoform X2 n=1 Tax=Populus euphratica TaxID=75702 RepID=A0AAJ6T3P3_POPEU|nr:PREDICTED: serine/threonine-protein kinase 19 isoform X2 [Populus euphratica]
MDSVAESSKNRKRLREEEEQQKKEEIKAEETSSTDQTLSLVDSLTFSDTMVALRIMRAQFPHIDKSLRREKVLRVFKLNTGQDDHAIMFLDDYLTQLDRVVKRMEEKKQRNLEVFEWFKAHVIDNKQDPSIDHQELCLLLSHDGKVKDEHISLLINAGLLTRQLIDPNMYWFSIPNIGSILKGLSQGRKELLSLLNRQRYKEMMLAPLEKKRLRLSLLDMRFHLRDLIGSGHLKTVNTPTGLLVRVSKD